MFNIQFILTFIFVFGFSMFTTMKCGTETNSIADTIYFVPFLVPFLVEILVFEVFLIYNIQFHYNYFQNFFKIASFALAVWNISLPTTCLAEDSFDRDVAVWALLFVWIYFFSVISINPTVGSETLIFITVGSRLIKLALAYSPLIAGYFFAFAVLLPGEKSMANMVIRMNTIFTMMMGEVNLDFIASSNNATTSPFTKEFWIETPVTANIVFLTFCCSVSIVVFNILTAFAIKDVNLCLKQAEVTKLVKQADYIAMIENSFLARYIDLSTPEEIRVTPGVQDENHFDKRMVGKWHDIIFSQQISVQRQRNSDSYHMSP